MASETELRARVEEISSAIQLQKQILRDLEKSKSEAQGELNAILDPVTRLPFDISSDIFLTCLTDVPAPNKHEAPLLFLNVCRSWSNIAISTPALWTTVRVQCPRRPDFQELLELWFLRARARSLRLSLHSDPQTTLDYFYVDAVDSSVVALMLKHANRMRHLDLYLPFGSKLKHITSSFPCLKVLTIGQGERHGDWNE
ncbi:hypothetical protein C8R43DRAFT_914646, partial [Mycena crocata]